MNRLDFILEMLIAIELSEILLEDFKSNLLDEYSMQIGECAGTIDQYQADYDDTNDSE